MREQSGCRSGEGGGQGGGGSGRVEETWWGRGGRGPNGQGAGIKGGRAGEWEMNPKSGSFQTSVCGLGRLKPYEIPVKHRKKPYSNLCKL